jgi:outer membrane protein OmpA-like peptidoglycan-associated protein
LIVTVAATNAYNAASATFTTLSTSASAPPKTYKLGTVFFGLGQSGVNSNRSRNTIETMARAIKAHKWLKASITAYTDKSGPDAHSGALSARRAASVIGLLRVDLAKLHYSKASLHGVAKGVFPGSRAASGGRATVTAE